MSAVEPDQAYAIHIECSNFVPEIKDSTTGAHKQTFLQLGENTEVASGPIMDYEIWDQKLAILLRRNQV